MARDRELAEARSEIARLQAGLGEREEAESKGRERERAADAARGGELERVVAEAKREAEGA
eukprot:2998079-Rhodomonas_salina.1